MPEAQSQPARRWLVIGLLALVGGLGAFAAFRLLTPIVKVSDLQNARRRDPALRESGFGNIVKWLLVRSQDKGRGHPPYSGRAFVLSLVVDGIVDPAEPGALDVMFSPADPAGHQRPSIEEYQALSRERLAAGGDFRRFTSYVGPRNGGLDAVLPRDGTRQPIVADLYFDPSGALVGFRDGSVEFVPRAELGLGRDDPIVAGPTSRSPILRQLSE
jgi:hypothetical protein